MCSMLMMSVVVLTGFVSTPYVERVVSMALNEILEDDGRLFLEAEMNANLVSTTKRRNSRLWKTILFHMGINWKKLPDVRTIIRVNVCCINSAVFFIGTWILFYAIVMALFCGVILGAAALFGVK